MSIITDLITKMTEFDAGDAKRIQHFLKVHSLCRYMGELEGMSDEELRTLEITAVLHDAGVIPAEKEFGTCAGPYQERLGPPIAMSMIDEICKGRGESEYRVTPSQRERIRYLIAHHHTYDDIQGLDYRILVEADLLVNMLEKSTGHEEIAAIYRKIFRTETGRRLCRQMFC